MKSLREPALAPLPLTFLVCSPSVMKFLLASEAEKSQARILARSASHSKAPD
jgi:hypothetical protein